MTMKKVKHTLYILTLLISGNLFAQELPKVSIMADTTTIRIGEQIKLTLQAETDSLSFIDFPETASFGDLEVVESSNIDTVSAKPIRRLKKEYYITQWDSGQYVLPQIDIKINDSILKTDSLSIAVHSVAVDSTTQMLFGFKEVVDVKGNDATHLKAKGFNWWWLLGLLLLIPLFFFLQKKRKDYIEKHKPLSAYEQAKVVLEKLRKNERLLSNDVDKYYLQLTDILKEYFENELNFSAKEKISSQLLADLQKYRFENGKYFDTETLQRLQATFQRADLAKFAQLQPKPEEVNADFAVIEEMIDESHRIIKAIEDENAAEIAEKLAAKKRKKRIAYTITGVIIALVLLIGGGTYYYLKKNGYWDTVKENIAAPEWVYSEYGGAPALGITTPHILNSYDIFSYVKDEKTKKLLETAFDEFSVYADNNIVKGYMIGEINMDFKQEIKDPTQMPSLIIQGVLKEAKATDVKVEQEELENGVKYYGQFTSDMGAFKKKRVYQFESKLFPTKTTVRMVIGVYLNGDKDSKMLIDRVMSGVEIVK